MGLVFDRKNFVFIRRRRSESSNATAQLVGEFRGAGCVSQTGASSPAYRFRDAEAGHESPLKYQFGELDDIPGRGIARLRSGSIPQRSL